jgi:hypothetical protein
MEGKPFNVTKWFNFYTFDIMGDLAFGRSFDMLKSAVTHYYMELAHANMHLIGAFSRLVWLFPLFKAIPGLNYSHIEFQKWLTAQVEQRSKVRAGFGHSFLVGRCANLGLPQRINPRFETCSLGYSMSMSRSTVLRSKISRIFMEMQT